MKKNMKLHPAKKKNNGTGVPKAVLKIGNNIMTIVELPQFVNVV